MWGWVWGWRVPMFDKLNYFRSSFSRCNLVCSKEDTQLNARKQKITQTFALGNINAHFYHSCFVFFLLLSPRAHTVSGCFNFLSHWLHSFLSFVSPPPFFPPPLLSYWVWWRPCLAGAPTPDPAIARRSQRIASLPVGSGHRNGLKGGQQGKER